MKRPFVLLVLLSLFLPMPVRAGMVGVPDPVEEGLQKQTEKRNDLIQKPGRSDSEKMTDEFQEDLKNREASAARQEDEKKTGSAWWKWALGILVVGGVAALAAGGGGGGGGASTGGATVTGSW